MSESMNQFPKELFDFVQNELGDYEDAMSDTRVREGANKARILERRINEGEVDNISEEIAQLDQEAAHVIGHGMFVSGTVTLHGDDGETLHTEWAAGLHAQFQGYTILPRSDDDDRVRVAYIFAAFQDDEGFITKDRMEALGASDTPTRKIEPYVYAATALIDEVSLDFAISTPERAMAWLSVLYPETLDEIDRILLTRIKDGQVTVPSHDEALHGLRDFELIRPEGISDFSWIDYKNAVAQYVVGMATIDGNAPYNVSVNGPRAVDIAVEGECDAVQQDIRYTAQPPIWLNVKALVLCDKARFDLTNEHKGGAPESAIFALRGCELADEMDTPDQFVTIPLSSMSSLYALRGTTAAI